MPEGGVTTDEVDMVCRLVTLLNEWFKFKC